MAKISKTVADAELRREIFGELLGPKDGWNAEEIGFKKINDRQYGILREDANGNTRYVRISAIVAELHEDMTAEELMQKEIDDYNQKQADKAEKAKAKEKKIAKDKARRETEKAKQEQEEDDPNQFLPHEVTY